MRVLCLMLLFVLGCKLAPPDLKESFKTLELTIEAHKKGLKMLSISNKYLGQSPVKVDIKVKIVKDENTKIIRYFVDGLELHSGDVWPYKLKVFMDGYPEPVTAMLVFDPTKWKQKVKVKKKNL